MKLKTYNGTEIPQLGTCVVQIEFKDVTKHCVFFVVLGNSQVLLGIPDTMMLNIINVNFDSIQAEAVECRTNTKQEVEQDMKQHTSKVPNAVINTTQTPNGQIDSNNSNVVIDYFYSSQDTSGNKKDSAVMTKKVHGKFSDVFNGIGYLEGTFSLQLKPDSKPYQAPPRHVAYALQKPLQEELE